MMTKTVIEADSRKIAIEAISGCDGFILTEFNDGYVVARSSQEIPWDVLVEQSKNNNAYS
jgi:hypothetical protein